MKTVSYAVLVFFLAWAVSVVRDDLDYRKIANKKIILGAKILAAALALMAVMSYLGYQGVTPVFATWEFYPLWGLHVFWSVLAAAALWYSEVWPAGDAKFFIIAAAALPLINPQIRNFPNYLFLSLLINIFVSAALFAVGGFIASGFYSAGPSDFFKEVRADLKKQLSSLSGAGGKFPAAAFLANMTFLFLLQQIFSMEARGFLGRFFSRADILFFFLFFLWDKIGGVFRSGKWLYLITAFYALYFFMGWFFFHDRLLALLAAALVNVARFSALLFFGRFMLGFLMEKKDTIYLAASELEPGMMLSSRSARTFKENPVFEGAFDDCFKDGLDAEQVGLLKGWLARLNVRDPRIEVVKGRPFALWIFAGALISIIFDKNLVNLLR